MDDASTVSVPSPAVLGHGVADVVDDIGVVAVAAGQRVVAGAAVERVVAGLPPSRVSLLPLPAMTLSSALPVSVCPPRRADEVFDVGNAGEAVARERGSHLVGARVRRLGDDVAQAVDDIAVVAEAAAHACRRRAPPIIVSLPAPPSRMSLPAPPSSVSLPAPPVEHVGSRVAGQLCPVAAVPVRFSTLATERYSSPAPPHRVGARVRRRRARPSPDACRIDVVVVPAPPISVSLPAPPSRVSLPLPPLSGVGRGVAGERRPARCAGEVLDIGDAARL